MLASIKTATGQEHPAGRSPLARQRPELGDSLPSAKQSERLAPVGDAVHVFREMTHELGNGDLGQIGKKSQATAIA
jgi:hypothetical protein